jgi:hypothetical protein
LSAGPGGSQYDSMRSSFDRFIDIVGESIPARLRNQRTLLALILLLGTIVRLWARDSVPNGFNNDEAGLAYDAWSILKFGVDRHGIAYPAFLIGWGSGMNALSAYLAMPFIAIFGLTEEAIRSVNLLVGLLSLVLMYDLVRRAADGTTGLWATFLLAICPWHVMLCRWGLESNLLPGVFLPAVWLVVKGGERARYLVAAGVVFGLCLYAYGTAYFAVPVFVFLASIYALWTRHILWRWWATAVAAFAVVATPIGATIWANQAGVDSFRLLGIGIPRMPTVARYKNVSILFGPHALSRAWENLKTLWNIVVKQDDGLIWNSFGGHGLLYPFGIALAGIGLLFALRGQRRWRVFDARVLMLLWFLTAVALGAVQSVNINRANLIWLPLFYLAAVGLRTLARSRTTAVALVIVHLLFFASFAHEYFGDYRDRTAGAFYPSYGQAIRAASRAVPGKICVTNSPCFSYAFVLFYDPIDPREFQRTVDYGKTDGEFQDIRGYGRYTFGIDRCPDDTQAWILDNGDVDRFKDRAARVERFSNYSALIAK